MIGLSRIFLFFKNIFYIFANMKTTKEFRDELYAKYGKRLIVPDDAEYIGNKKNIKVICPKHGVKWMKPNNLLSGAKCRDCGYECVSVKNSDTLQNFLEKAHKTHGDKYDYPFIHDEYGKVEKIHILCKKCGKLFEQRPAMHIQGNGCSNCHSFPQKYTTQALKKAITKKHPDIELISEYNGDNDSTIKVRCKKHDIEWETTPHRLNQQKHGCRKCYDEDRIAKIREKQAKIFQKFIEKHYKPLYDISNVEYINEHTDVKLICPTHGEFTLKPTKMLYRLDGCPYCNESHLEREIRIALDNLGIKYIRQKSFEWLRNKMPLRLDFYLVEHNIAIECQGEHHINEGSGIFKSKDKFQDNFTRDKLKLRLCKERNIPIIYIFGKHHSNSRLNEQFNHMYDDALFIEDIMKDNTILLNKIKRAAN